MLHTIRGRLGSDGLRRLPCSSSSAAVLQSLSGGQQGQVGGSGRLSSLLVVSTRCRSTKFAYPEGMKAYEDDWTEEAEYPEIDPEIHLWNEGRRKRLQDTLDWHRRIREASCPEAKNFQFNAQKQFGYKVFKVTEDGFDYDSLNAYKFVTRTHIASNSSLPSQYSSPDLEEKVEHFKEKVKEPLLDALKFELDTPRSCEQDFNEFPHTIDFTKSQSIISQVNRAMLSVLGQEVDHLKGCQVDKNPKVEAFWQCGGLEPSLLRRNMRKGSKKIKSEKWRAKYVEPDDPVEYNMHYIGNPLLQLRCKDPPANFVDSSDDLCKRSLEEFPDRYPHFLQAHGFRFADDYRFASFIPGHWSGDEHRCNLLAFHGRSHLLHSARAANKYWSAKEEIEESMFSQAMLVSFGRLVSQALYHGFDQYGDLEYPFSTQTVITNGLDWSFFAYQLNTMKLHQLAIAKNQKQNVIWGTQTQSIFDKEKKDELNEEVLRNLLRFYLNPPQPIQAENPTPYLTSRIQDWEDDKDALYVKRLQENMGRILTHFNFREQVSQRPYVTDSLRQYRPPEIYDYERIYKVIFNTMPLEPRRRHYELPKQFPGAKPWDDPYKIRNPIFESKGVRRQKEILAKKKEQEAIEAAKIAEGLKYGVADPRRRKK